MSVGGSHGSQRIPRFTVSRRCTRQSSWIHGSSVVSTKFSSGCGTLDEIKKLLDERTEAIEGGLQKAEVAQAEAERIKQEFTAKLAESRHEAAEVRAKAQAEGAALVDKARDEAVKQRESIVAAGHAQLNADRNSAVSVLKAELGKLAVELADKIIGERSTDAALQERVIDRFLDDLDERLGTAETTAAGAGASEQVG